MVGYPLGWVGADGNMSGAVYFRDGAGLRFGLGGCLIYMCERSGPTCYSAVLCSPLL